MELILGDAAVFNVKNAFERLHIKEVDLLQVLQQQRDAAQLFPHQRSQVQVQGLFGADGHAHQDAQELELEHVLVQARRRVEEEPAQIKGGSLLFSSKNKIFQNSVRCGVTSQSGKTGLFAPSQFSSPVSVVADLCGGVGRGDEQIDHARLQLLQTHLHNKDRKISQSHTTSNKLLADQETPE